MFLLPSLLDYKDGEHFQTNKRHKFQQQQLVVYKYKIDLPLLLLRHVRDHHLPHHASAARLSEKNFWVM